MTVLTKEDIEKGQTSPENWIRQMWSTRDDYTPTLEQVFRGLKDPHEFTALGYALREDYTPTKEMVEYVLKEGVPPLLRAYLARKDVSFSNEDYSYIFDTRAAEFRAFVGKLTDWCPTVEQLNKGLNDPAENIRELFNFRRPEWEHHLLTNSVADIKAESVLRAL